MHQSAREIRELVAGIARSFGFRGTASKLFLVRDGIKYRLRVDKSTVGDWFQLSLDVRIMRSDTESSEFGRQDELPDIMVDVEHLAASSTQDWLGALDGRQERSVAQREAVIRRGFEMDIMPYIKRLGSKESIRLFLLTTDKDPRLGRVLLQAYDYLGVPRQES